ncbi:MAG: sigma-70 family RNA polymerase sigma factor [Planctomycetota bacterium]|jgi:RNA polymerase sigma factor (sigma-70 family)
MTKNIPSETELLKASLRGQTLAFEVIVQKYQSLICAITYSATGSVEKSEELAQQAFVKGWKNLGQLKDLSKFRAWLCSITRRLISDSYRKQQNDITSKAISMDSIQEHPSEDIGPIEAAISKEREAIVNEALSKIPETYREPLVLYYREDKSYRQVADQLGFSEHTARDRVSQGRNLLREKIASFVEDTIERTKPSKVFTTTVIASIVGLTAIKGSGVAAAGIAATSTPAGIATGVAAVMSGITAKIITAVAVVAIGVGVVITYKHFTKPERPIDLPQTAMIAQEREEEQEKITEEINEQPSGEMATLSISDKTKDNLENGKSTYIPPQSTADKDNEFKFAAKGVLSGLITDADTGEPVADTQIRISCGRIYQTKTDEHGFYAFDQIERGDNYKISINSWDHIGIGFNADRPPTIRLENGKKIVRHFKLKKACMVELTVKDEDGKPLEEAKVRVSRLSDNRGWSVGAEEGGGNDNRTNKEGFVLLGGLPPNDTYFITIQHSYWVRVEGRKNFRTHRFDYAPAGIEVFLADPNQIEVIEVVLKKGQKIRGYAQYQDGEPADDITIVPEPDWWHASLWIPSFEVDPNGFFTLEHIVPGTYNIQVRIPQGDGWSGRRILQTQLPPAESDILYVDIPLKSPKNLATISGTIEWIGEKRPRHIEIEAYSAAYGRYSTRIWDFDKDTFLIDRMEPGTYRLKVEGDILEPLTIENVQAPLENLVLELTCAEKPRLTGTVADVASKKPLPKYEVRVRKLETLRGPHYTQSDRWFTFEDINGAFEIEVVGPGIYEVQAKADGYAPVWSQKINTDQNSEVSISLSAGGGSIKGRVLNVDSKPIESATVIPLSKASGTSYSTEHEFVSEEGAVKTNKAGEFLLRELPSGLESLKINHPDYTFVIEDNIKVKAGHCTDNINVILPKGGIIEGVVYDQNGEPEGGVVIYAQNEMGHSIKADDPSILATVVSEPNGFYRTKGLPEGICYLIRKDEWNTFGVVRRTIVPQYGKTMHVDFGGTNMVSGQIIIEGTPLANQKVIISSPYSYYSGSLKAVVKTDSEGRFVFLGIAPGHYGIFYEMNRQRSDWFRLAEFEMGLANHDFGIIPKEFSILYLTIQQPIDSPWDIRRVNFKSETPGSSITIPYEKAMNANQPYKVGPVTPGRYSISVNRLDNTSYTKKIEITRETKEVTETILLPEGDSAIYGTITDGIDSVFFQSVDESIQGYIRKNDEGGYKISHLPAGDYRLGSYPLKKDNAIAFSLMTEQPLEMNIDLSLFDIPVSVALAIVTIVSEKGTPRNASVYLSANGTIIEPEHEMGWQKMFIVEPNHYLLHIHCEGYQDVEKQITVKPVPPGERANMKQNQILIRLKRSNTR